MIDYNKAIIIGTWHARHDWLRDCLASLQGVVEYPIIPLLIPWELNAIKWTYQSTDIEEFIFLQDTVIVKDPEWIYEAFAHDKSVSLCTKPFYMYLGKYTRADLNKTMAYCDWPEVRTKRQAVTHEGDWTSWYDQHSVETRYLWDLEEQDVYVEHNGRLNKFYENDYIIKYKGTWSPEMIPVE